MNIISATSAVLILTFSISGCSRQNADTITPAPPTPGPLQPAAATTPAIAEHPTEAQAYEALRKAGAVRWRMLGSLSELNIISLRWGKPFVASAASGGGDPFGVMSELERPNAGAIVFPAEIEIGFAVYAAVNKSTMRGRDRKRWDFFVNAMGDLSACPAGDMP